MTDSPIDPAEVELENRPDMTPLRIDQEDICKRQHDPIYSLLPCRRPQGVECSRPDSNRDHWVISPGC